MDASTLRRLALAPILTLALLGSGCGDAEPPAESELEESPTQVTYSYHTTQTRAGIVQWELWGETARRFPSDPILHLDGVRMHFFRNGMRDAELTSESGQIDETSYDTVAMGDVVVVTEDGKTLRSDVLYWDNDRELIHTDQFVHFTENDQVLTGVGLETDPNLTNLTILQQVEASAPLAEPSVTPRNEEEAP